MFLFIARGFKLRNPKLAHILVYVFVWIRLVYRIHLYNNYPQDEELEVSALAGLTSNDVVNGFLPF